MKSFGLSLALLTVLSLAACLEAQKVDRTEPVNEQEPVLSSVMLSLPRAELAVLGRSADRLLIRAFKVEQGTVGAEVREAYDFQVTDAGLYTLEGLPLGEVEFQVTLFDKDDEVLANGSLRATINLGAQTLPQLVLKPVKPTKVDLNLGLAVQLVNFPDTPAIVVTEPEAMRTIVSDNCVGCHSGGGSAKTNKLDLRAYPYKNVLNESPLQILTKIEKSLTGSLTGIRKMPLGGAVSDGDAATVRSFLQVVTDAASAGNVKWVQDVRLALDLGPDGIVEKSLTLKDGSYTLSDRLSLTIGSTYPYTLTVFGPNGSKLLVSNASIEVPLDGKIELKSEIVYQAPNVTIPVVVGE